MQVYSQKPGTKLYCLATEPHVRVCVNNLLYSRYLAVTWPGVEPATSWSQVRRPDHYDTPPLSHTILRRAVSFQVLNTADVLLGQQ